MQPDSAAHVWDAVQAARAISDFVRGRTEEDFAKDLLLRSAVERQLEILGEALNRVRRSDAATASRVPDVDRIIGMRNVIAHQYAAVDQQIVWAAATSRIGTLLPALEVLLAEAGPAATI